MWFSRGKKALAPNQPAYLKEYLGPPGAKGMDPDVIAKIRTSNKSTVSGKLAKILFAEVGTCPPRALEIAVRLDDVAVEP